MQLRISVDKSEVITTKLSKNDPTHANSATILMFLIGLMTPCCGLFSAC